MLYITDLSRDNITINGIVLQTLSCHIWENVLKNSSTVVFICDLWNKNGRRDVYQRLVLYFSQINKFHCVGVLKLQSWEKFISSSVPCVSSVYTSTAMFCFSYNVDIFPSVDALYDNSVNYLRTHNNCKVTTSTVSKVGSETGVRVRITIAECSRQSTLFVTLYILYFKYFILCVFLYIHSSQFTSATVNMCNCAIG